MFQYKKSILYFSFFTSLCFYTQVFAAYFQNVHKMSNNQITLLFAIFSFATFLSEIPAGIIGDRIGEKTSLVISSIFVCLSTIVYLYAQNIISIGFIFLTGYLKSKSPYFLQLIRRI